jgi:hypothetical protein
MNAQNTPLTGIVAQYGIIKNGLYSGNISFDTSNMCFKLDRNSNWEIIVTARSNKPFNISIIRNGSVIQQANQGLLDFAKIGQQKTLIATCMKKYLQEGSFKNPLQKGDEICVITRNCNEYDVYIYEIITHHQTTTDIQSQSEVFKIGQQIIGGTDIYQIEAGLYSLRWNGNERYFTAPTKGTLKLVEGQWYFNDALVVF